MKVPSYWVCVIGPVEWGHVPEGGDLPPRTAALMAVEQMVGSVKDCWSGWGCDEQKKDAILAAWF